MTLLVVDSHSCPPTAVLVVPFKRNRCIGAISKSTKNFEVFSDCQKIVNQSKTSNAGVVGEWGARECQNPGQPTLPLLIKIQDGGYNARPK